MTDNLLPTPENSILLNDVLSQLLEKDIFQFRDPDTGIFVPASQFLDKVLSVEVIQPVYESPSDKVLFWQEWALYTRAELLWDFYNNLRDIANKVVRTHRKLLPNRAVPHLRARTWERYKGEALASYNHLIFGLNDIVLEGVKSGALKFIPRHWDTLPDMERDSEESFSITDAFGDYKALLLEVVTTSDSDVMRWSSIQWSNMFGLDEKVQTAESNLNDDQESGSLAHIKGIFEELMAFAD